MADHKTRISIADHVANVKTKNGAKWHANQALAGAQSELAAYMSLDSRKPERVAELEAAVATVQARVTRTETAEAEAKAALDAARARLAELQTERKSATDPDRIAVLDREIHELTAGDPERTNSKPRSVAAPSGVKGVSPESVNVLLTQFTRSSYWTPDVKRSLVDWLDNQFGFYAPAPFSDAEQALIAAHAAVDSLPVDDATKQTIRATMAPKPTRPAPAGPPDWGVLAPATNPTIAAQPTEASKIAAQHAAARELAETAPATPPATSLADSIRDALAKAPKQANGSKSK